MGDPEECERKKRSEYIFEEIMAKISKHWWKKLSLHIQEPKQIPSSKNTKRFTHRQIIVKLLRAKDTKKENIKAAKEKLLITYNKASIWTNADFSFEKGKTKSRWMT